MLTWLYKHFLCGYRLCFNSLTNKIETGLGPAPSSWLTNPGSKLIYVTPWRTLVFSRREQGWRLVGKRWALSGSPIFCIMIDGWPYMNPGDLNFLVCIHSIPIHDVNFYPLFDFTKYTKSGTFTRVIERWQEQNSKFKYQGPCVGCSSKTATVDVWKSGFCSCKEQESSLTLRGEATPEGVWRQSWGRATWWRSQGRARLLCPRGKDENTPVSCWKLPRSTCG